MIRRMPPGCGTQLLCSSLKQRGNLDAQRDGHVPYKTREARQAMCLTSALCRRLQSGGKYICAESLDILEAKIRKKFY